MGVDILQHTWFVPHAAPIFTPRFGHPPNALTHAPPAALHASTEGVGVAAVDVFAQTNAGQFFEFNPSLNTHCGLKQDWPAGQTVLPSGQTTDAGVADACTETEGTGTGVVVGTGLGKHWAFWHP